MNKASERYEDMMLREKIHVEEVIKLKEVIRELVTQGKACNPLNLGSRSYKYLWADLASAIVRAENYLEGELE